ncbi:UNKNOWN [Stylonychia lemnae]|uniref:Uncharacterized protein n=1 Tax=Stylonychia lemnae TaxID=5949 RepID=A0A078A4D2_STYLE|nr:UNKNOWN [Stylonychia lemnae]|eukprot:CDW75624.1 UNKNOWN [Stylonychia lemnae]
MECTMIAQTHYETQELTCYQYLNCQGFKNEVKRLNDLSRNVLIIVCEYLSFFQIVMLSASNKKIKSKLDNFLEPCNEVSYLKRRAIINFQSFFFEQFPCTEVFFKRMSSITSSSTMASSASFLPLTKQSSLCIQNVKNIQQMSKQVSTNPFDLALEATSSRQVRSQLFEKMEDNKQSNYIEETYRKWRDLYMRALNNKQNFVKITFNEFYSAFMQEPDEFAREIFLDPSLCENPCFALPQLTRENFTQKGLFYRTEKILVQNYHNCFQKYSVDYTKQLLWETITELQSQIESSEAAKAVILSLIYDQNEQGIYNLNTLAPLSKQPEQRPTLDFLDIDMEDGLDMAFESLQSFQKADSMCFIKDELNPFSIQPNQMNQDNLEGITLLYKSVSAYTLRQFKLLCNAHNNQLDFILQQINMAPPQKQNFYVFLEDYIIKEKNLRFLFKKVTQNFVVQESFGETVQRLGILQKETVKKSPYFCDFLLLELMDSIWINEIYRSQKEKLIEITKKEIAAVHCIERIEELAEKQETFRKVINLVHQMEFNLESGNPIMSLTVPQSHLSGIFSYETSEFHKIQELEYYYVLTKKHYLAKAFSNELATKLENNKFTKTQNCSPLANSFMDLNLNQIIPQDLINSFFHQVIRNLLKEKSLHEFMDSEQFLQSLFVMFHIDQRSKVQFSTDVNQFLIEQHKHLDEMISLHPELYGQVQESEESKEAADLAEKLGCSTQNPFTLIEPLMIPELNRGYSDQKKQYQKAFRAMIFSAFIKTELEFDFKNMILKQRQEEKRRMVEQINQRINNFNFALQQHNRQDQINEQNVEMTDVDDIDQDNLPDPESLFGTFTTIATLGDINANNNTFNFHIGSSQDLNINKQNQYQQ